MGDGAKIDRRVETGPTVCWWCGYDLDGVDLIKTDLKCPECGKDNVPGNGPDTPHVRLPWPAWWVLAAMVCWPGALVGMGILAGSFESHSPWVQNIQVALSMIALPAAGFGILWPPLVAEWIVDERVAGMFRRRWLVGVSLGGIAANFAVAAAVFVAMKILAEL